MVDKLSTAFVLGIEWLTDANHVVDWCKRVLSVCKNEGQMVDIQPVTSRIKPKYQIGTATEMKDLLPTCGKNVRAWMINVQMLDDIVAEDAHKVVSTSQSMAGNQSLHGHEHKQLGGGSASPCEKVTGGITKYNTSRACQESIGDVKRFTQVCEEFSDVFEEPGMPLNCEIELHINLID